MPTRLSVAFAVLIAATRSTGLPQTNARGPEFEVTSVRPATPLGPAGMQSIQKGGPGTGDPGTFTCQNCSLYWVLADAYKIHPYDFVGPDWLQAARFDFSAKLPAGASEEDFHGMIANLLIERFGMVLHREMRQMDLFEMTVAKNGLKFKEATPKDPATNDGPPAPIQRDVDGFPILTRGMSMAMIPGHARLRSENQSMAWFAEMLSNQLRSPVRDATGLTAKYDFVLSWSWDESSARDGSAMVDLFTQVPAQLGLKLEKKKGPIEVLIIDHMERTATVN